jgi:xanthine dehydrogenase accessory factor
MLGICEDGRVIGSVSGGCIEDDLIARVQQHGITRIAPEIVTYGISADEAHRFGLPCGGTIQLAIEPLTDSSRIGELLDRLADHELTTREVDLASGAVTLRKADAHAQLMLTSERLITVHGPRWRLLIIGAGQLSRFWRALPSVWIIR